MARVGERGPIREVAATSTVTTVLPRRLGHRRRRQARISWVAILAVVAALTTVLAGMWVVLSSGNTLLALAPVAALIGGAIVLSHRQAAAYVMLASLPFAEVSIGHGTSLVRYILIGALAAWFIGASVFESFEWLRPDRTDLTVLLWVLGAIFSAVILDAQTAPGLTQTYLNLALVYYLASRMIRNERQARGAVLALTVGLGFMAILTLAFPHLTGSVAANTGSVQRLAPLGASDAAGINRFAGWLAVGTVLPWVALDDARKTDTLVARALSVAMFAALVATVSKAALIALGVGLVCWVALGPPGARAKRGVGTLMALCVGWVLLPVGVHQRFAAFGQSNSDAYSRFAIWDAGLRMFLAHPFFGVGLGNYSQFAPDYFPQGTGYQEGQAAHDILVGALAETGIVGTSLLLIMVGSILFEGTRLVRIDRQRLPVAIEPSVTVGTVYGEGGVSASTGIIVGYLAFLVVAMSVDLQQDRYFVVLAGLVHGLYRARSRAF